VKVEFARGSSNNICENQMQTQSLNTGHAQQNMNALHASDSDSNSNSGALHERLALDMQERCSVLLEELEQFQAYLKEKKKEAQVEVKGFKNDLRNELKRIRNV
jgi:hypothetical protein